MAGREVEAGDLLDPRNSIAQSDVRGLAPALIARGNTNRPPRTVLHANERRGARITGAWTSIALNVEETRVKDLRHRDRRRTLRSIAGIADVAEADDRDIRAHVESALFAPRQGGRVRERNRFIERANAKAPVEVGVCDRNADIETIAEPEPGSDTERKEHALGVGRGR